MALRDQLNDLLAQFEPELRDAFIAAFADVTRQADLARIVARLEAGDIEGALAAVHIDASAFAAVQNAIEDAFEAAGVWQIGKLPTITTRLGQKLIIRFDARNIRAEQLIGQYSSTLVREVVADQIAMLRSALRAAMEAGTNPRTAGLDVVGRVDRATNARFGGIIGLTSQQEGYARAAELELASADPALLQNWLSRVLRDKRYDSTVLKAIKSGIPIDATTARNMIARYRAALLKMRGETVARTEAMTALHMGQDEAMRQLLATGQVAPNNIRRIWRSAGDNRVRDTHKSLNGTAVGPFEAFQSPSGAAIMYPGDPNAPAAETINCRCDLTIRIDFLANIE